MPGGLAGAARATGASVPTLGRRMAALEVQIEQRLFLRGARGYTLTSAGRALIEEAAALRGVAARLNVFGRTKGAARVRITAGLWTSRFLARNIGRFWRPEAGWIPEFLPSDAVLDISRRAADIGIRNRRPTQSWLAGRRTAEVAYAPFAVSSAITGWVALPEDNATTPSQRWLWRNERDRIVTTASDPRLICDLARAGVGKAVLPVFAGLDEPDLVCVGPDIAELTHEEWLVSHHATRHDPPVRAALDSVAAVLTDTALRPQTR